MSTVGRNDPCPCGSGRKHKHCCLAREDASQGLRARLFGLQDDLTARMLAFARQRVGPDCEAVAWKAFTRGFQIPFSRDAAGASDWFHRWMVMCWEPGRRGFLEAQADRLSQDETEFLLAWHESPYSFFQVRETRPDVALTLRDILLEEDVEMPDRAASRSVRPAHILYAQVVRHRGQVFFGAAAGLVIPPSWYAEIMGLRKTLAPVLKKFGRAGRLGAEEDLRATYFDIREEILTPRMPVLQNTDGEPLEFVTIQYELGVPLLEAARRLVPLTLLTEEEALAGAERGPAGEVVRVELAWGKRGNRRHKGWDHTVLGTLKIEERRMTVEVNSREREARIRQEIATRLGEGAVFLETRVKSVEAALSERRAHPPSAEEEQRRREEERRLVEDPQVRAHLEEDNRRHWESWPDQKLPALGHKTARQAVKTKEGRELVEALLLQFEHHQPPGPMPLQAPVEWLRRTLGLANEEPPAGT